MNKFHTDRPTRLLFALFCCSALAIMPAAADTIKTLSIEGHVYELVLTENTELADRLTFKRERILRGSHYRGHLQDIPDSWVRASLIAGHWQGVVSINGASYILDLPYEATAADRRRVAEARISDLSATPIANFAPRACGVKTSTPLMSAAARVAEPASALLVAREVAFSSLCATTINGTCLIAELEVAFDKDFVASFEDDDDAADQALAMVNITEGFYLNDFDISFEALSLELLTDTVSTETNANDLLADISDAKDSGTFNFLQNTRSLFHFVTGRELDGGTAGIAFLDEICTTNAVGVTSLLTNFLGAPNISLTGIVMAHELGHNFGADHDGDTNACGNGFIMEATVNSSTSEFSSCSIDEITGAIEDVANPALCFNFPADAGISAAMSNPTDVPNSEEFTASYSINLETGFQAIPTLAINGSVPASQGRFTTVTLNGQSCAVNNQGQSYMCNLSSPPATSTLLVNSIATGASLDITHTTALPDSNDNIRDVDASNDQLVSAFAVTVGDLPAAPSGLAAVQGERTEVDLSWQDNSNNETGFIVERRRVGETFAQLAEVGVNSTGITDTTSSAGNTYEYQVFARNSSGSSIPTAIAQLEVTPAVVAPSPTNGGFTTSAGGGGGSLHWSMLLCLAGLAWRRLRNGRGLAP